MSNDRLTRWTPVGAVCAVVLALGLGYWLGRRPPRLVLGGEVADFHDVARTHVPMGQAVAATVDLGAMVRAVVDENAGLLPVKSDPQDARAALSAASLAHFGVDFLKVERATLIAGEAGASVLLEGDLPGPLKGIAREIHGSASLVMLPGGVVGAVTKAGLVLGDEEAARLLVETIAGNHSSLVADSTTKEALDRAASLAGPGAIQIVADTRMGPAAGPLEGLTAGAVSVSSAGAVTIAIVGSGPALDHAAKAIEDGKAALRALVSGAVVKANASGDGARALLVLLAKHKLEDLLAYPEIRRERDALVVAMPGASGAMLVAYLGGFGAVFGARSYEVLASSRSACERGYDHTLELLEKDTDLPADAKANILRQATSYTTRQTEVARCEAGGPEMAQCLLAADSLTAVGLCSGKHR